jgi:hypothetical protein
MTGNIPGTQCGPHLFCKKNNNDGKSVCASRELTNFSELTDIKNFNQIQTN